MSADLYPCSRGANDNPDGWLKLVAGKDEYGNDLYPEPIIVSEIKQQILTGLMPHLVEWAKAAHPDTAGITARTICGRSSTAGSSTNSIGSPCGRRRRT